MDVSLQILWSGGAFFLMGLAGGFLLVPMEAFFQVRPGPEEKGAVIAAANFAGFSGIALAGIVNMTLNDCLSPTGWFGAIGLIALAMGVWLWSALRKEAANA